MRKANKRRHNVEPFTTFRDLSTMDHVSASSLIHNGLSGEMELLVVSDLATGFLGAYPVGSESAERVLMALSNFLSHVRPKELYTERAPEHVAVVRGFPGGPYAHRTSISGVLQTNGIAEPRAKQVTRSTRALPLEAALLHVWWSYAARLYAMLHNNTHDDRVGSSFTHRHGGNAFIGPLIPFGALVYAMPSSLHKKRNQNSNLCSKRPCSWGMLRKTEGSGSLGICGRSWRILPTNRSGVGRGGSSAERPSAPGANFGSTRNNPSKSHARRFTSATTTRRKGSSVVSKSRRRPKRWCSMTTRMRTDPARKVWCSSPRRKP